MGVSAWYIHSEEVFCVMQKKQRELALEAKFNDLSARFTDGDESAIEDVNLEMQKSWREFLKAGFDAKKVLKMLPKDYIWEHYDELWSSFGVRVNVTCLMRYFDNEFIETHWNELQQRGADMNDLLNKCHPSIDDGEILEELLLKKGVSAKKCFELSEGLLARKCEWPEKLLELFGILHRGGLPTCEIKTFIDSHMNGALLRDIVDDRPESWKNLGIQVSDYADDYLRAHGWEYLSYYSLKSLPKDISLEKFVSFFNMKDILGAGRRDFCGFIKEFVEAGGDPNLLAEKCIQEIGYPDEPVCRLFIKLGVSESLIRKTS